MKTNVLNENKLEKLLSYIDAHQTHYERDRLIIMMTFLAGMKPSDIVNIKVRNILSSSGSIVHRLYVSGRVFIIPEKLRSEIKTYLLFYYGTDNLIGITYSDMDCHLFYTQKRGYFSANTLSNYLYNLYSNSGIKGSAITGSMTYTKNIADSIHCSANCKSMNAQKNY